MAINDVDGSYENQRLKSILAKRQWAVKFTARTIGHIIDLLNTLNLDTLVQGRTQGGGALGVRAPPLDKKCLEGSTGLKNYSQVSNFFLLASTPLSKFLGTPLHLSPLHWDYSPIS